MPHDTESGWTEANVVINGRSLSFVESMTLRVAIGSMRISMNAPTMRAALGELATNYDHHLARIEETIIRGIQISEGATSSKDAAGKKR